MDVELTVEESTAVQRALRSYCADLRMEIVDTDNPAYKRDLKDERTTLEGALAKIDAAARASADATRRPDATEPAGVERTERVVIRLIGLWPS